MNFWDLVGKKEAKSVSGVGFLRFAIVSGDFPKSGVALPFGNRKVRAAALREFYLYKGKDFWSKAKINLLRIFNFSFVWKLIFPRQFSVNIGSGEENILSFFGRQLSLVNGRESNVKCSIYVGSRKFILPIFDERIGDLLGVAKLYFPGKESVDYGENEAKTLDFLKKLSFPGFYFPKVLAKGYFKDSFVVILSSPHGLQKTKTNYGTKRTTFQHSAECWNVVTWRVATTIQIPHLDFLKELSKKTGAKTLFLDSGFYKQFQEEINFLRSKIPDKFSLVEYFWSRAIQNLKNKEFIFSLTKREFPFFEIMRSGDKSFVIDWEVARFGFPPIFDLFSLLMSTGKFKKGNYVELYEQNIKYLFFSKNAKTKKLFIEQLEFWGLSEGDAYYFFLFYLIDQLYIHLHVGHLPSAERILSFLQKVHDNESEILNNWILN